MINLMQRGTHTGTVAAPWRPLGNSGEAMNEYLLATVTCPLSERQKICVKGRQAHIGQKTRVYGSLDIPGGKQRQTKADGREREGQGLEREMQPGRSQNRAEMYLLNSKCSRRPWRKFW